LDDFDGFAKPRRPTAVELVVLMTIRKGATQSRSPRRSHGTRLRMRSTARCFAWKQAARAPTWPSQFALLRGWVASNSEAEAPKLNKLAQENLPICTENTTSASWSSREPIWCRCFVDGFASEATRKASIGAPFNAGASVPKADDLAHYSAKH